MLQEKTQGIYLTITRGMLVQRVKADTAGAISRQNKNGDTVWEKEYQSIEGYIRDISTREHDYGKDWVLKMDDGKISCIVQMGYRSGYAVCFFNRLSNLDLTKMVKLSPFIVTENDKTKSRMGIFQQGATVKSAHSKENPNGMPAMKETTFKGEQVWDDTEKWAWVEEQVKSLVWPGSADKQEANGMAEFREEMNRAEKERYGDDLPF